MQAFSEFIATSAGLELSYRELQAEVSALSMELAQRNQALKASVNENELMRLSLQRIVNAMPCGVLVADAAGTISIINPECRRLFGMTAADAPQPYVLTWRDIGMQLGARLSLISPDEDRPDVEQEIEIGGAAKRWLHVQQHRMPCTGERKSSSQTIVIVRDVTSRKLAERDRESGRISMALAEISGVLAHEMRNPLASLELFAELIENDESRRTKWISNLRAGIRLLGNTVNNVLSFHGAGEMPLTECCLTEVVRRAVEFMQPLAAQAMVSLAVPVDDRPIFIHGNESALHQVLLNILTNALRHTPEGGAVMLSVTEEADGVSLECADTGTGLVAEQTEEIFQPGFSAQGSTPGLGLAVSRRIMAQHGGSISAENRVDGGARFMLRFPKYDAEAVKA